jgi:hypothetical protein
MRCVVARAANRRHRREPWDGNGPQLPDVIQAVDDVIAGTQAWTRMPSGAPGPKVEVVPARFGHERIDRVDLDRELDQHVERGDRLPGLERDARDATAFLPPTRAMG